MSIYTYVIYMPHQIVVFGVRDNSQWPLKLHILGVYSGAQIVLRIKIKISCTLSLYSVTELTYQSQYLKKKKTTNDLVNKSLDVPQLYHSL